jgi:hypothetical protein
MFEMDINDIKFFRDKDEQMSISDRLVEVSCFLAENDLVVPEWMYIRAKEVEQKAKNQGKI